MRAIPSSLRPKCSHRCVSLKESSLKPVPILKHATKRSAEQTPMRKKWFKYIMTYTVQEHLLFPHKKIGVRGRLVHESSENADNSHVFLSRVQWTVSGSAPPQHPPDSIKWTLFRCSVTGLTVSSKPCLETLPYHTLQTPSAGHCLDTHGIRKMRMARTQKIRMTQSLASRGLRCTPKSAMPPYPAL